MRISSAAVLFLLTASVLTAASPASHIPLVRELIEERAYREAVAEAARITAAHGADAAEAELLGAVAGCRAGGSSAESARAELRRIRDDAGRPLKFRCAAAMEEGSFESLRFAFMNSSDPEYFNLAGCAVYLAMRKDKKKIKDDPRLYDAVVACRNAWPSSAWHAARDMTGGKDSGYSGIGSFFGRGVVGFYRFFIRPAIGNRCVLTPSCSEFFILSSRKHGFIGVPMTADRLTREPVLSATGEIVRMKDGTLRRSDPVENHDFWFRKSGK